MFSLPCNVNFIPIVYIVVNHLIYTFAILYVLFHIIPININRNLEWCLMPLVRPMHSHDCWISTMVPEAFPIDFVFFCHLLMIYKESTAAYHQCCEMFKAVYYLDIQKVYTYFFAYLAGGYGLDLNSQRLSSKFMFEVIWLAHQCVMGACLKETMREMVWVKFGSGGPL